LASLEHPSKFQRASRLRFVAAPTLLNGGQPNFARCLTISWAATLYIHLWGLLSANGILTRATFALRPSLVFSYIDSVTVRHSSSARQPNFAACDKKGRKLGNFRSSFVPPIFRRAAITLIIGPHSSCKWNFFNMQVNTTNC